ncbi:MAG: glycosyltransferase family 1 protein, partial [Pseudomonadota bacterium]
MSHPDGPRRAAMAIPGDLNSLTGGYIYDLRLIAGLRRLGRDMRHLQLGDSFPDPTPFDNDKAARCLADVPADCPVIMDGLALGVIDQAALQGMSAPIVGMIHHPLAL